MITAVSHPEQRVVAQSHSSYAVRLQLSEARSAHLDRADAAQT